MRGPGQAHSIPRLRERVLSKCRQLAQDGSGMALRLVEDAGVIVWPLWSVVVAVQCSVVDNTK